MKGHWIMKRSAPVVFPSFVLPHPTRPDQHNRFSCFYHNHSCFTCHTPSTITFETSESVLKSWKRAAPMSAKTAKSRSGRSHHDMISTNKTTETGLWPRTLQSPMLWAGQSLPCPLGYSFTHNPHIWSVQIWHRFDESCRLSMCQAIKIKDYILKAWVTQIILVTKYSRYFAWCKLAI